MVRSVALVLAGLLLSAPLAATAQTEPITTLHVGVLPAEICGGVFYGIDRGYFKKAGINVDVQMFTNGNAIAAGLASGALDVGLSDVVNIMAAHTRGLPLVYIAPSLLNTEKAPTFALIVAKDGPIHTAKDVNGKTIAVNGLKNVSQLGFEAWVDNNGGDSKTIKWVEMPFPVMPGAIAQGTINGGLPPEPALSSAEAGGDRVVIMDHNAIAPEFLLSGWVTTRSWADAHRDTVKKFAEVIREAALWANKNHDESAPILASYTKIPVEVVRKMRRGDFATEFVPAQLQPMIEAAVKYGIIDKSFPMSEIVYSTK
jgi:NitT/TauT family transport system substrate-binding protein